MNFATVSKNLLDKYGCRREISIIQINPRAPRHPRKYENHSNRIKNYGRKIGSKGAGPSCCPLLR